MEAQHSHTHCALSSDSSLHGSFQRASMAALTNITSLTEGTAPRQTAKTKDPTLFRVPFLEEQRGYKGWPLPLHTMRSIAQEKFCLS